MRHNRLYTITILFVAHLLTMGTALRAQTAAELAAQADEYYRQADYPAAIETYEKVIADGQCSPELFYNLGNAYYRNDQMASAILNYERALRLRPSMRDAEENLALANSRIADRITPLPQLFITRWWQSLTTHISPAAWRVVFLVILALIGVAAIGFFLGRNLPLRKASLAFGIVAILLLLVTGTLLASSTARYNAHSDAIVMEPAISVKSSPEQQSTDKLILHQGTKVHVLEQLTGWYKIRIADGTTGWCETDAVERI